MYVRTCACVRAHARVCSSFKEKVSCLLALTLFTGVRPQCPTPPAKEGENSTALECNNGTATCLNGVSNHSNYHECTKLQCVLSLPHTYPHSLLPPSYLRIYPHPLLSLLIPTLTHSSLPHTYPHPLLSLPHTYLPLSTPLPPSSLPHPLHSRHAAGRSVVS